MSSTRVAGGLDRFVPRVLEQDAQVRLGRFTAHDAVGLLGLGDREAMRHQSTRLQLALGDQVEERRHVALLGPAHVANRVVDAVLLVGAVVAAWPIRARQPKLQLLFVVRVARHVHADHADGDDHGAVARQAGRQLDRDRSSRWRR